METTIPGRQAGPSRLLTYSAIASAAYCERSRRSSRRLRKMPRRRRGMVRTTWRCGTAASTSFWSHSAHRSWRFFSHDGQNDLPRHENGQSTLARPPGEGAHAVERSGRVRRAADTRGAARPGGTQRRDLGRAGEPIWARRSSSTRGSRRSCGLCAPTRFGARYGPSTWTPRTRAHPDQSLVRWAKNRLRPLRLRPRRAAR